MSFKKLGLIPELVEAVTTKGYAQPTPIQAKSIPHILNGRDLRGSAQTGTGKTAAFTLPILQIVSEQRSHHARNGKQSWPRALIITPTRELASQIGDNVTRYGEGLDANLAVIFGGVGMNPQTKRLKQGVDILVATPGRLLDHAQQRNVNLSKIDVLVLDEADRMLDMGFIHDIKRVLRLLPKQRQNLLFSATYTKDIKALAGNILNDPAIVEVAPESSAAEKIRQVVHPVAKSQKRTLLAKLIKEGKWKQVLVFTRTKHGANKLAKQLEQDKISADAIHGNKSQGARTRALGNFKSGKTRVLVATDVASRGLDIKLLPHVVNFELPNVPEDYVHRIGRTGRAEQKGTAYSLVSFDERKLLKDIEKVLKKPIPVEEIEGFSMDHTDTMAKPKQSNSKGRRRNDEKTEGKRPPKARNPYNRRGPKSAKRRPKKKA